VSNRPSLRIYEWATGVLGLIIIVHVTVTQGLERDWLLVGCWALSYLLFSDKTVFLTPDAAFMPGYPIVIAALSTTGLSGAAWLVLTSFLWHGICNSGRISRIAFNMGSVAIALLVANSIMVASWGTSNLPEPLSTKGLVRGLVMVYGLQIQNRRALRISLQMPHPKPIPTPAHSRNAQILSGLSV
jgi:hypothetical protein